MIIQTKYFDEIEINKEEVFHFKQGLPGFPDEKELVLLPLGDDSPFLVLQSIHTPALGFITISPFTVKNDYEIKLPEHAIEFLQIMREKDVELINIVTLNEPFQSSTVNLLAPIVMNRQNRQAKQVVLNDKDLDIRHPLFQNTTLSQEG